MAKFQWQRKQESLVKMKAEGGRAFSLEFLLTDPTKDNDLFNAQRQILVGFDDENLLLKIKGNLSKMMAVESGFKTAVPVAQILRGLKYLVDEAQGRVKKSPWDHERLETVAKYSQEFYKSIRHHNSVPSDTRDQINEHSGAVKNWSELTQLIFGVPPGLNKK